MRALDVEIYTKLCSFFFFPYVQCVNCCYEYFRVCVSVDDNLESNFERLKRWCDDWMLWKWLIKSFVAFDGVFDIFRSLFGRWMLKVWNLIVLEPSFSKLSWIKSFKILKREKYDEMLRNFKCFDLKAFAFFNENVNN